ncbi:MAG: ATP-binding protein, partial [Chloroflexota bacterium]
TRPAPAERRSNLPVQLTSFVGREQALADLAGYLTPPGGAGRLLTLAGAGGCGKTRLALQAAACLVDAFPDGVWLVELAALTDPSLVPQTTYAALGVREVPPESVVEALVAHLRPKRALLVLDNCEHVVGACAALVAALLRGCPDLRVIATSREPLHVPGEVTWRVPPLSLPPPGLPAPAPPERLVAYEAVRLFFERAQAVQPGFALSDRNAAAVAQICSRLDGIPLAIELAAARVPALPVAQLAGRLDDCFRLLTDGSRTSLARHRTLEAAIDWSYDLLSAPERLLLNRLAVFAGGWTLEAAEAVASVRSSTFGVRRSPTHPNFEPRTSNPELGVLEGLVGMVDKSLVLMEEQPDGTARYRLLEPIRQYGRDRLAASGEGEAVQRRHAACYLALAEQAEPELTGPQQGVWLHRLEGEHDNLRQALHWALEGGEAETGLRLGAALWRFWKVRGHLRECRWWVAHLLRGSAGASAALRAKALSGASQLARIDGNSARAAALLEEGLALRRQLGDKRDIATALAELAVLAIDQGDWPRAAALLEEGLALRREVGDTWGIAASLHELGIVAREQGDAARAAALLEEGLTLQRERQDDVQAAWSLYDLGVLAEDHQSDLPRAAALYEEALRLWRGSGYKQGLAQALGGLASLAYRQGDAARAATLWRESLALWWGLGRRVVVVPCLESLASAAAAQGQAERAARLFGMAETLGETIGAPRRSPEGIRRHQRGAAAARAILGEEAFAAAWEAGRALPLEQAVAYALAVEEPAPPAAAPPPPLAERPLWPLSRREHQVVALVADGLTNRQIAARLAIAEG